MCGVQGCLTPCCPWPQGTQSSKNARANTHSQTKHYVFMLAVTNAIYIAAAERILNVDVI